MMPSRCFRCFRCSVAALALGSLTLVACSGDGVTGPNGEQLDTRVSASRVHVGDSIEVFVIVTNLTGHRLDLVFGSKVTYAQVSQGNTTYGANVQLTAPDTLALASDVGVALRPVTLHIVPPGYGASPRDSASESLSLTPGAYDLAACVWVISDLTPEGRAFVPACGQSVTLTVTP